MTILVTGGTGAIGSHIATGLVERGQKVRLLSSTLSSRDKLPPSLRNAEFVAVDIRDADALTTAMRGVETVYHFAGAGSPSSPVSDYAEVFDINTNGTRELLKAAGLSQVRKVLLASSASVYGDAASTPTHESSPVQPQSVYASSKAAAEDVAHSMYHHYGIAVDVLRIFNVYGPCQSPSMVVPRFIHQIRHGKEIALYGNGEQVRDFVYISDLVEAALGIAKRREERMEVFNIASGEGSSIASVVELIAELMGREPQVAMKPARAGEISRSVASIAKLQEKTGFLPRVDLREGLRKTIVEASHKRGDEE